MTISKKETWVYKDVEYSTYDEAREVERKDIEAEVAAYDPTNDIASLKRRFDVLMHGTKRQREAYPDNQFGWAHKLPLILWFQDKYQEYNYLISTPEDMANVAFDTLKGRVKDGHWYFDEDEKLSSAIVEKGEKEAALEFLLGRSENQYEKIKIKTFEKIGDE